MPPKPPASDAADAACIVFPRDVNWFYERFAERIQTELNDHGIRTELCAARDLCGRDDTRAPVALLLSPKECIASLPAPDQEPRLLGAIASFKRRILVNYDCIHTDWFLGQFTLQEDLITEIADVNMLPQTEASSLCAVPYHWIPECFTTPERATIRARTGARPLRWAVVGHSTPPRAALVDALVRRIGPQGFTFLPPHRPYRSGTGTLTEENLNRVLRQADLYVWISHHEYPYHECLRALQAISNGAVPAKVDPLFSDQLAEIPWVFRDVESLAEQVEAFGLDGLYKRCADFVLGRGSLGEHLASVFVDAPMNGALRITGTAAAGDRGAVGEVGASK